MIYKVRYLKPHFYDIVMRLKKRDKSLYNRLMKKIILVSKSPRTVGHELSNNLKGLWDTHVSHHVLIYHIDEKNSIIRFIYFDHHDQVFKRTEITLPFLMADLLRID